MTAPDLPTCLKCGKVHVTRHGLPACSAHIVGGTQPARKGHPCTRNPMNGLSVCPMHGGRAAAARAVNRATNTQSKALATLRRFGEPVNTTPTEALLDTVKWTAGYVAWLRDKVAGTRNDESLVWGVTREKRGGDDWGTTSEAGPNVWLKLLGEWSDRLVRVCEAAIKAGVEERRVRLAEQQGALIADVIKAILADLGLTAEQQGKVAEVVPLHLRKLIA